MSDDDINAICDALEKRQGHVCRFTVPPGEIEEAMRFQRHVNALVTETGSTLRKTIIVAGIGRMISLLVLSLYAKLKSALGL